MFIMVVACGREREASLRLAITLRPDSFTETTSFLPIVLDAGFCKINLLVVDVRKVNVFGNYLILEVP